MLQVFFLSKYSCSLEYAAVSDNSFTICGFIQVKPVTCFPYTTGLTRCMQELFLAAHPSCLFDICFILLCIIFTFALIFSYLLYGYLARCACLVRLYSFIEVCTLTQLIRIRKGLVCCLRKRTSLLSEEKD
jgi:hypothetical protein